jgi:hypothetical protein
MEKRRHRRIELAGSGWRARLIDQLSDRTLGEVVNLSPAGMMLLSGEEIAVGALFQVTCIASDNSDQEQRFDAGVSVLWRSEANQKPGYWAGLQIIDLDNASRERLLGIAMAMERGS